jgi:hypothetical protein
VAVAVASAAATVAVMLPARADTTYTTFTQGPASESGTTPNQDSFFNHVYADPATGRVAVLRSNPEPGALNCAGTGAFDFLRVAATGPASKVTVTYTQAAFDPFTFLQVLVRQQQADGSYAYLTHAYEQRGPVASSDGTIQIPLDVSVAAGMPFIVDVGLETASACPNVDGGTVTFTGVTVG